MAKEAGKPSTKKKKEPKKKKRPAYCPNTSKSFNLSISRSKRFEVSSSALKKNNEELAKNLNLYKVAVARLEKERATQEAEIMDLRMEIGQLRAAPDPQDVEAEVQRRVKEHMAKINGDIRAAIDHSIGLSTILTQLCVTSSRASVSSTSQTAISRPRSSDIGGSRMRQVVSNRTNNAGNNGNNAGNTWTRGSGGNNSPPKQLSKVSPMVAGHAISRPRIQLARMDLSSITVQDPVTPGEEQGENIQENDEEPLEDLNQADESVLHDEELAATPPIDAPTRNVFDLTNIREESTLMEDSVLDMEETLISPSQMEVVQEEQEQEDMMTRETEEPVTSTRRVSVTNNTRHSIRQSLQPPPRIVDETAHSPSPSNPPPDTSPYVLDAETTPVGVTREPIPGPSVVRSVSPNQSTSLTESFFERLGEDNALEGPSWLFASVQKKKRRSGAVRKLSCIMSDLDTSSNSVLDTSDLPSSKDTSSNFILDQDLRESLLPTASTNKRLSLLSSANERLSGVLDLNNDVSNQENVPVDTDNVLNVTETRNIVTPRTPLSSLKTCVDQGGNQVNLKEARIMLNNVGVSNENSPAVTPVGTRKKTMTLDELFSFGVRGTPTEPETTNKRKYGSDSQVVANNKPQKKPRTTEISSANVKLQNLEVRLEKNVVQPRRSSENSTTNISEPNEREGRSRRQKTQVSYKEPSLMKKMRREGDTSSLNYGELKPPQKKKIGRKKKLDSG